MFRSVGRRGYFSLFEKSLEEQYIEYIESLSPLLWYRLNEISGTTVINHGSAGISVNGTWSPGVGSLGQTGWIGENEAYDFDGANSRVILPDVDTIRNIRTFSLLALVRANSMGENSVGTVFKLGNQSAGVFRYTTTDNRWTFSIDTDETDAIATTSTSGGFLPINTWATLFGTYDDAGDRLPRFYKSISGVFSEGIYTTHTAGTGNMVTPVGAQIGNHSTIWTWDGLIDEIVIFDFILSQEQMLKISNILKT